MSRIAGPRFGIWTPVYGTWGATTHPEDPFDASWERAKQLVLSAEKLGYDSTLIAQHIVNPYGHEIDILETWTAAAGLASLTSNIEIIAAIKPTLFHRWCSPSKLSASKRSAAAGSRSMWSMLGINRSCSNRAFHLPNMTSVIFTEPNGSRSSVRC